jgi:hypothetical protein
MTAKHEVRVLILNYALVGNALVSRLMLVDSDGTAVQAEGINAIDTARMMLEAISLSVKQGNVQPAFMCNDGTAYTHPSLVPEAKSEH